MATLIDVNRIKAILLQPGATWRAIEGEFTKPGALYRGWVLPLAAVAPVCSALGMAVFGLRFPIVGATFRVPLSTILTLAAVDYLLALAGVFALAQIVNVLAPTFGAQRNDVQALKVAAYGSTAWFVAGVFGLIPQLAIVAVVLSLYSLYLVFAGVGTVMKPARDQAMGYGIVAVLGAVVVALIVLAIHSAFVPGYASLRPRV